MLIDAGADLNAENSAKQTPLHRAAIDNRPELAKALIDAGADKGAKDDNDFTPWDYAHNELRQSLPELKPNN
jgi:ankyrin repeat protein